MNEHMALHMAEKVCQHAVDNNRDPSLELQKFSDWMIDSIVTSLSTYWNSPTKPNNVPDIKRLDGLTCYVAPRSPYLDGVFLKMEDF